MKYRGRKPTKAELRFALEMQRERKAVVSEAARNLVTETKRASGPVKGA